jgi:hypothetical protein
MKHKYKIIAISNATIVETATLEIVDGSFFGPHNFDIPTSFLPDKKKIEVGTEYEVIIN